MTEIVEEKLKLLPDSPGVYIMKDSSGNVIYVGKAIILKNRVRQYFQSQRNHTPKVRAMVSHVADFETILTHSEVEALILECNLIKKHRPRYNISLKDDKTYPYLKLTMADPYPRLMMTRRILKDGAKYFGPYTDVTAMHESVKLLRKMFPMRTCRNMNVDRPCLEYHIKRCIAPCTGKVDRDEYMAMVRAVSMFLEGHTADVERDIEKRMYEAADDCAFELAARLRDQLMAVRKVGEKQNIVTGSGDQDAVGMARSEMGACVMVFYIRAGKMVGREHFLLKGIDGESDEDVLYAFLQQYYNQATYLPHEVLLPIVLPEERRQLLEKWLTEEKGAKVSLLVPKRGTKRDIVEMAGGNAGKFLSDEQARQKLADAQTLGAVEELGRCLGLKKPPMRMECFDISHNQGVETVASMVVFEGGVPKKSDYRRYKINSTEGKPDDFKSMREVTTRRYTKLSDDDMPDLIVMDGGKGQLSSALEIIRGAGHMDTPVIGLAKRFELVYTEGSSDPVVLPRNSQALYLIQRIRDEAHRFAITYHRKRLRKHNLVSILDHIDGIGPKRRKAVWDQFGSINKIKAASVDELAGVDGMTRPAAEAVHAFFALQADPKSGLRQQ